MPPARTKPILIKLTPAEHAEMSRAATESGLGLGPWLRVLGIAAARETRPAALVASVIGAARVERQDRRSARPPKSPPTRA